MRRYRNKKRTKQDKRAAATQFVIMSGKSDAEKVRSLVASYGFREAEAHAFIKDQRERSLRFGVSP